MKRIILCILCISLLFSGCSMMSVEEEEAGRLAEELASFSAEDRANLGAIVLPMLWSNAGLDLAKNLVLGYNPESDSMQNEMLHPIFRIMDQQTALDMLAQMYKIDEPVRRKYFEGLHNREEARLSVSAKATLENFFAEEIREEGLEQVCREDGITAAVLLRFFGLFIELNGNAALLTDGDASGFKVNTIHPLLDEIMLGMTAHKADFTSSIKKFASKLNNRFDASEKQQLKRAFYEVGLYAPSASYVGGGLAGGGVLDLEKLGQLAPVKEGFTYKISKWDYADGDTISVAYFEDYTKVVEGKELTEPLKIAIPVNTPNVMLYYEGEGSVPVKHTAYANGMLYCRIEKVGTYKLCKVEPYFLDANDWGKDYIEALYCRGIISGKSAGIFAPEAQITREEFVKLAVELFGLTDASLTCDFKDVPAQAWYAPYIASAKHHGIVNGVSAEQFGVGAPITRQDMCKILHGMLEKMGLTKDEKLELWFNDALEIASYAAEPVRALVSLGIINGDDLGNFNPTNYATRQEAAKLIYGMLLLYAQ